MFIYFLLVAGNIFKHTNLLTSQQNFIQKMFIHKNLKNSKIHIMKSKNQKKI